MKTYTVQQLRLLSEEILEITLRADHAEAAALTPGSHYRWHLPGSLDYRCYSCVLLPGETSALKFAMRLSAVSESSQWLSGLQEGDNVTLSGPFNHFPQLTAPAGGRNLVIAGGIGITPLTGVLTRLSHTSQPTICHYFAACATRAAYISELAALPEIALHTHYADGPRISLDTLLSDLQPQDRIHACGPARLLTALLACCDARGFPREHIAFEVFTVAAAADAGGYEVEATESGVRLRVNAGQSLLEALEEAGLEPLYDCRRGECGICALEIVAGDVDHRDFIMTPQDAATSTTLYPCVSHAKGPLLKLAL